MHGSSLTMFLADNRPTCRVRLVRGCCHLVDRQATGLGQPGGVGRWGRDSHQGCLDITRGKRHDGNRGRRIEPVILDDRDRRGLPV